ncbi:MAG TPA: energy-coupling factor ABC transporter permease [Candidatus Krumholzibacteria bacterium]|nr:energy-coupling factor ABC transporter permease [Candidatus Krumholzibacteria bacterium]
MHVPDGFLGPQTWLPAAGVAAAAWSVAARRVRRRLRAETIPALGVTAACCFGLMLVAIPLPAGASVHATGVAVLALRFGLSASFLAISLVLALQALLLGDGGVTSLPVTALALGLGGGAAAVATRRLLSGLGPRAARFGAGWTAVMTAALLTGLVLGLQPQLGRDAAGAPLYFPFGWRTVLPALLLPHAVLGLIEGAITVAALDRLGDRSDA